MRSSHLYMYVCMYIDYIAIFSMSHPGKVANPARGQQQNRETGYFLVLVVRA